MECLVAILLLKELQVVTLLQVVSHQLVCMDHLVVCLNRVDFLLLLDNILLNKEAFLLQWECQQVALLPLANLVEATLNNQCQVHILLQDNRECQELILHNKEAILPLVECLLEECQQDSTLQVANILLQAKECQELILHNREAILPLVECLLDHILPQDKECLQVNIPQVANIPHKECQQDNMAHQINQADLDNQWVECLLALSFLQLNSINTLAQSVKAKEE